MVTIETLLKTKYLFIVLALSFIQPIALGNNLLVFPKEKLLNKGLNLEELLNKKSEKYWRKNELSESRKYAIKALSISKKTKNEYEEIKALINLGVIHQFQGKYADSIFFFLKALKKASKKNTFHLLGKIYYNLGSVYFYQNDVKISTYYYKLALYNYRKIKDEIGISKCYINLGNICAKEKKFNLALMAFNQALKLDSITHNKISSAYLFGSIGLVYIEKNQLDKALKNLLQSEKILLELNDIKGLSNVYLNIAIIYDRMGDVNNTFVFLNKALNLSLKIRSLESIKSCYKILYYCAEKAGNYKDAYHYFKEYIVLEDSISNESLTKRQTEIEMQYKFDIQKSNENQRRFKANLIRQKKNQQQVYLIITLICIVLIVLFFLFQINKKRKIDILQKQLIEEQKRIVEQKNSEILDSINYAQRIQKAIFPSDILVKEYLTNSFIYYNPKDIVAGDFYWLEPISNGLIFAVADCTGHGVPGALVSVICNNALNRSVREFKLTNPGQILDKTRELILCEFEKSEEIVNDGMDISICNLDYDKNTLYWAGANSPLWIIKHNSEIITEYKPNKQPIGNYTSYEPFKTHSIHLNKGDKIYLFTDGYADQFGGPLGKKMKPIRMKELLLSLRSMNMKEQRKSIDRYFEYWKNEKEQIDDVCIIGIEV